MTEIAKFDHTTTVKRVVEDKDGHICTIYKLEDGSYRITTRHVTYPAIGDSYIVSKEFALEVATAILKDLGFDPDAKKCPYAYCPFNTVTYPSYTYPYTTWR